MSRARSVAVGTAFREDLSRPPHRSQRVELPHWALISRLHVGNKEKLKAMCQSVEVDVDPNAATRSQQLYSMLQPYAARLQALLERLAHENHFDKLAEEDRYLNIASTRF
jgi:hypothetical protein